MNKIQTLLIELLYLALNNSVTEKIILDSSELQYLLEEAKAQEVHTLLYPLFQNIENDAPSFIHYQSQVLSSLSIQINHETKMKEIFEAFLENKIEFLPLKGLVLRNYYPYPELRSMGDGDIYINRKDLDRASQILIQHDYKQLSINEKHINFGHPSNLWVELHFHLVSKYTFPKYSEAFEEKILKDNVQAMVCDTLVCVPQNEDQLIFMLLHMAGHMRSTGIGLRQLADIYVLVKRNKEEINWDNIYLKTKEFGLETFTNAIFKLLNTCFKLEAPEPFIQEKSSDKVSDKLLQDIFSGGSFGNKDRSRIIFFLKNHYKKNNSRENFISFLFPSASKLCEKYTYLKRNSLLLPLAWIQRIVNGILRKDFSLKEKSFLVFSQENSSQDLNTRTNLLHSLDLY